MKTNFSLALLIVVAAFLFSTCKERDKVYGEVKFETIELTKSGLEIDPDTTKSYEADVRYYKLIEAPDYLEDSVNTQTKLFLSNWLSIPKSGNFDINELLLDDMRKFYKEVDELNDPECFTCRVKNLHIRADTLYQNNEIISITYGWYVYEGGAHGNHGKVCYNFKKSNGEKITYKSLVIDEARLLQIAEKAFREQNGITDGEKIYDMFYFENETFSLNDNFCFTDDSLIFYYNPYEIAPYAAGLIELILPFKDLKGVVNFIDIK